MPIFDQGYQHWTGQLSGHALRWWTISRYGARVQMNARGTRYVVMLAWLPALVLGAFLSLWGLIEQKSSLVTPLLGMFRGLPEEILAGPREYRLMIWTLAYQLFFRVELFFSMLLVLLVGPSLISQDLRFNAIPLYLSRPLRRIDYFLGKLGVIGLYLGTVAIVPAVLAWLVGVGFSMDVSVMTETLRLLGAAILYGGVVVLSMGTLMLALSSLSRNSRYVGGMWVGIWILSGMVAGVLTDGAKKEWGPTVSYAYNLQRTMETLLDTDAAWKKFERLMQAGQQAATSAAPFPMQAGMKLRPPPPPRQRSQAWPTSPWHWSAGVLAGLFGLSACILMFRVKSLDRLK